MTEDRIRQLLNWVPVEFPLYVSLGPGATPEDVQKLRVTRLDLAISDPEFPWFLASVYAKQKTPLPSVVDEPFLFTAYDYLRYQDPKPLLEKVLTLREPRRRLHQATLRGLLLQPKVTLNEIASTLTLPTKVVDLYESLFWNVRDRRDDRLYVASLLWPDSRHVVDRRDYFMHEDVAMLAMRAAATSPRGMMHLTGIGYTQVGKSAEEQVPVFKSSFMNKSIDEIEAGGMNHASQAQGMARALTMNKELSIKPVVSLTQTSQTIGSIGSSIMANLVGSVNDEDYKQRLAKQDAERAGGG